MKLTDLIEKARETIYQLSGKLEKETVAHIEKITAHIFTSTIRNPNNTILGNNEKELLKVVISRLLCEQLRLDTNIQNPKNKIYFNLQLKYTQLQSKIENRYKNEFTLDRRKKIAKIASDALNSWQLTNKAQTHPS